MSDIIEPPAVADLPASRPQSTDPADHGGLLPPAPAETTEQPQLPPEAAVPEAPKGQQYPKWEMERIRVMARVNGDLKKQMADQQEQLRVLQAAVARQGPPNGQETSPQPAPDMARPQPGAAVYTQDQVQAEVQRLAAAQSERQQFETTVKDFAAKGAGSYEDWGDKIASFEHIGGLDGHPEFVKAVLALPNGSDVLYTLGANLDHANHVLNNLSGVQQAMALVQLSGSLATASPSQEGQAAPAASLAAPNISRAPAPTRSVGGRPSATGSGNIYDPKISMEDYAKLRSKTA